MLAAVSAVGMVLTPALAAESSRKKPVPVSLSFNTVSTFTPASADARLAAVLGKRSSSLTDLQFTPAPAKGRPSQVRVAIRARAFGMKVIAHDIYWDDKFAAAHDVKRAASLDEVYAASDYLSLHTNLTPETRDMISAKSFPKMKKGVLILNCARGEVVHTADLVEALKSGQDAHCTPQRPVRSEV